MAKGLSTKYVSAKGNPVRGNALGRQGTYTRIGKPKIGKFAQNNAKQLTKTKSREA